jgi:hypothetical protein
MGMVGFYFGHYIEFWANSYCEQNEKQESYYYNGIPNEYISTTWIGYRFIENNIAIDVSAGLYNQINLLRKNEPILTGDKISSIPIIGIGIGYLF